MLTGVEKCISQFNVVQHHSSVPVRPTQFLVAPSFISPLKLGHQCLRDCGRHIPRWTLVTSQLLHVRPSGDRVVVATSIYTGSIFCLFNMASAAIRLLILGGNLSVSVLIDGRTVQLSGKLIPEHEDIVILLKKSVNILQ